MSARPIDLIAAARQRLAVQRHWRAVARAGGDRSASVNRAEYRADQARQCLAALATTRRIDMPTLTLIAPELRHISDPAPARYPRYPRNGQPVKIKA